MRPERLGFVLSTVGLILSLVVGVLVYMQVADAQQVRAALPTTMAIVAATDIPPRSEIAASMLTVTTIPDPLIQTGAAAKVEDVAGKFTPEGFARGEVISTRKLAPAAYKSTPSYSIEKGKVMYVMPVSFTGTELSITRVNALRAGDRVDLLYTTVDAPRNLNADQRDQVRADPIPYLQTRIMLQNLRIQEIGSYGPDGALIPAISPGSSSSSSSTSGSISNASIIFFVSPEEALVLKWLKDAAIFYKDSSVEMVLRSPTDEQQADNNLVVNLNYMQQKYNLAPPPATSALTR